MEILSFDENIKQQIRKVVEYAKLNVYDMADLLDMKNGYLAVPGANPEHLVRVPYGRWICYYITEHKNEGRSHCFSIKPDIRGNLPNRPQIEQILKAYGIEGPLLDHHINIDKGSLPEMRQLNQLMNELEIDNPAQDNDDYIDKGLAQTDIIIPIGF